MSITPIFQMEDEDFSDDYAWEGGTYELPSHTIIISQLTFRTMLLLAEEGHEATNHFLNQAAQELREATSENRILPNLNIRSHGDTDPNQILEPQTLLDLVIENQNLSEFEVFEVKSKALTEALLNLEILLKTHPTIALEYITILNNWDLLPEEHTTELVGRIRSTVRDRIAMDILDGNLERAGEVWNSATQWESDLFPEGIISSGNLPNLAGVILNIVTARIMDFINGVDRDGETPQINLDQYTELTRILGDINRKFPSNYQGNN